MWVEAMGAPSAAQKGGRWLPRDPGSLVGVCAQLFSGPKHSPEKGCSVLPVPVQ